VTTLMGRAVYERAYYYCPTCRGGHFPTDEELGVVRRQTPATREVTALLGVLEPFEEGADKVLPKLCGLILSASTVQRTTEDAGADVAARRAAGETIGPEQPWAWHRDAAGRTVGYVSLDATGVLQQGPRAEKAEGRMPWVGAVFNPQPTHERTRKRRVWEARYVCGLMSLPEIGAQLRRECRAVSLDRADVVIGLTDGGAGLEHCLLDAVAGLAAEIVFILDFYHASEHLLEFAKVLIPDDDDRRQQMDAWCQTLKHRGGRVLFEELERLDLTTASATVCTGHASLLGYLRNNLHRMDYPTYIARGWQIGSGLIESACKSVVGRRLKGSGMRWRERGTTALCQLRALYKSQPELWNHYWARTACT
jgi:hypothetical protein